MQKGFIALVLAAMPACAVSDDGGAADGSITDSTTSSSPADDGACSPGTEGCECIEGGLCVEGLVCASNLCVDLDADGDGGDETGGPKPDDPPATTGGSDDGGDDGAAEGSCEEACGGLAPGGLCSCTPSCEFGDACCPDYETACPGECVFSTQCDDDEVCGAASLECVPAYEHTYEVRVIRWEDHTPDCWDAGDCYADVKFKAYYGSQGEIHESSVQDDTTVASWAAAPFKLSINATDALQFIFFDVDLVNDDPTNSVCFPSGGVCGPVTVSYLHEGGATWDTTDDPDPSKRFYIEVSFTAK